jgi:galactonate dehydratase
MRVSDVKTFIVHPGPTLYRKNWLFVKVETDDGLHGWGECYTQADRDRAIEAHVDEMKRYLIGRSPFDIKHFTTAMYLDFVGRRGSMEFYSALSGIEMALWDVVGKALRQPVYNLLGGLCRDRIRIYANGWAHGDDPPDEVARRAVALVERGFSALKWDPFPGPWRSHISSAEEDAAVESIRAVREAVGPRVDLLVECHRRLAPQPASRIARRVEEFSPFWYEEPVSARNVDALAEVHRRINLPVVTGEELYTKTEFREVFERRAADILNPDVCACGGILELREIAAMAEPYGVAVSPHNYNSTTIGLAATIQAAAGIPNFLITEYFVNFEQFGSEIADEPFEVVNGYIKVPTRPGLGIELRDDALLAHPYEVFAPRNIRQPADEGP